jgi:hypothetical protein
MQEYAYKFLASRKQGYEFVSVKDIVAFFISQKFLYEEAHEIHFFPQNIWC